MALTPTADTWTTRPDSRDAAGARCPHATQPRPVRELKMEETEKGWVAAAERAASVGRVEEAPKDCDGRGADGGQALRAARRRASRATSAESSRAERRGRCE